MRRHYGRAYPIRERDVRSYDLINRRGRARANAIGVTGLVTLANGRRRSSHGSARHASLGRSRGERLRSARHVFKRAATANKRPRLHRAAFVKKMRANSSTSGARAYGALRSIDKHLRSDDKRRVKAGQLRRKRAYEAATSLTSYIRTHDRKRRRKSAAKKTRKAQKRTSKSGEKNVRTRSRRRRTRKNAAPATANRRKRRSRRNAAASPNRRRRSRKNAAPATANRRRRRSRRNAAAATPNRRRRARRNVWREKKRYVRVRRAPKHVAAARKGWRTRRRAKRTSAGASAPAFATANRRRRRKARKNSWRGHRAAHSKAAKKGWRKRRSRRNAAAATPNRKRRHKRRARANRRTRRTSRRAHSNRRRTRRTHRRSKANRRSHRSHRRRAHANRRSRRNGFLGQFQEVLKIGAFVGFGLLSHKLFTSFACEALRKVVLAPPATKGIGTLQDIYSQWEKPICGFLVGGLEIIVVNKVVKGPRALQINAGIFASWFQSLVTTALAVLKQPAMASRLEGADASMAYRLQGLGGGHMSSIGPQWTPVGEYFAANGLGMPPPAHAYREGSLGEYFAADGLGSNGLGEYFAANGTQGVGYYEKAGPLAMQAAAGAGAIDDGIRPDADLDRVMTITESASGLGVSYQQAAAGMGQYRQAAAGMGTYMQAAAGADMGFYPRGFGDDAPAPGPVTSDVATADTWIPNGPFDAGSMPADDTYSESEIAAGILHGEGDNGILS